MPVPNLSPLAQPSVTDATTTPPSPPPPSPRLGARPRCLDSISRGAERWRPVTAKEARLG